MAAANTESLYENHSKSNNGIVTSNLSKTYRDFKAVDSLTLNVESGDIFGFLGPNGAGKTTTIRMLCGLVLPSSGTGKVAGFDIVKDSVKIRSIVGLLPESSGFYGWMNAQEHLVHFALLYKIEPHIAKKRARDLLEKVGLAEKVHAPISYYSRGMRQRLGLARTLINDPKIIFLDEPTLGLDPSGQLQIRKILLELNRDKGVTIFLSSHALGEVASLCNKIAIIDRGALLAQGSIDELRKRAGIAQRILVRVTDTPQARQQLLNLPFPSSMTNEDVGLISIKINTPIEPSNKNNDNYNINDIIDFCMKKGLQIYDIQRPEISLEEIFFKMTGLPPTLEISDMPFSEEERGMKSKGAQLH